MSDFTIRPPDGWQIGDRAYCVRGCGGTVPMQLRENSRSEVEGEARQPGGEAMRPYEVYDATARNPITRCALILYRLRPKGLFW